MINNDDRDFIKNKKFKDINVNQKFFDSLREDYGERKFNDWFHKKENENVFVIEENSLINGFLYLKKENEPILMDNGKIIKKDYRLKIGTFKLPEGRGTSLGQRFMRILLNEFITKDYNSVYVTIFNKQKALINLFKKFGFQKIGLNSNGEEIWIKYKSEEGSLMEIYPKVNLNKVCSYHTLAISPNYHTKMFPESMLNKEKIQIEDLAPSNTIEKTYLSKILGVENLKEGDLLFIYRSRDNRKNVPAHYSSVITTVVTVTNNKNIDEFESYEDFIKYIGKGSVFSDKELHFYWENKTYSQVIKFLYNFSLPKRLNLKKLKEILNINKDMNKVPYWGFVTLKKSQVIKILKESDVNESFIIN